MQAEGKVLFFYLASDDTGQGRLNVHLVHGEDERRRRAQRRDRDRERGHVRDLLVPILDHEVSRLRPGDCQLLRVLTHEGSPMKGVSVFPSTG